MIPLMKTIRIDKELCDGCGLCVSSCVEGALELIDGKARLVREEHCDGLGVCVGDCPRGAIRLIERPEVAHAAHAARPAERPRTDEGERRGLAQWPIQLHLVHPRAPYFRGTDLLLAADCAAFARADFHSLFRGHSLAIACPKLDDPSGYAEKLAAMMGEDGVRSVTVTMMEVPCCRGLERLAVRAALEAGRGVPLRRIVLGIDGEILCDQPIE